MKPVLLTALVPGFLMAASSARAQTVLFDFDNAPIRTSLPVDVSSGGLTAHLSATGQGFSIQPADTLGFRPTGFSGLCIYPNSVFAADLGIIFSRPVTTFSILYSPQELGCDDSARLRVTADLDGTPVGTAVATAPSPGTWPTGTLQFNSSGGFNHVVIHYDARPPTCQDWGPIFLADNMEVTPTPEPVVLTDPILRSDGTFQFTFGAVPGGRYEVLAAADLSVPLSQWSPSGSVLEVTPGNYQASDPQAGSHGVRYYRVQMK
ncbi:MAG: hypothetical protein U1G08_15365 [Verrucomicrobiota bacterium]